MRKKQENIRKKGNVMQRLLSMALCLVMCGQLLPVTAAYAAEPEETAEQTEEKAGFFQRLFGGVVETAKADETKLVDRRQIMTDLDGAVVENISMMERIQERLGGDSWMNFSDKVYSGVGGYGTIGSTIRDMNPLINTVQKLWDCLKAEDSYFGNYPDFEALKNTLRRYVTGLRQLSDFILSSYTRLYDEKSAYDAIATPMHNEYAMPMAKMLSAIESWDASLQEGLFLLEKIAVCIDKGSNGAIVIGTPGMAQTLTEAGERVNVYLTAVQSCYHAFIPASKTTSNALLRETREATYFNASLQLENGYLASLKRYCELRLEDRTMTSEMTIRSTLRSIRSDILKTDEMLSTLQQGIEVSSTSYRNLDKLKTDIKNTTNPYIAQLELALERMGANVSVMSYEDAKAKLDTAYEKLNAVILASAVATKNNASGTNTITESAAKGYLTANGINSDTVQPLLDELQRALLTMIEGVDDGGTAHLAKYTADLKTAIDRSRGNYSMPSDLSGLLAMQMADLYAGEWQIKNLAWGDRTVTDTITFKIPEEFIMSTGSEYLMIFRRAYDGLEHVLREAAQRAALQETMAANSGKISSDADIVDCLREEAQKRKDAHFTAAESCLKTTISTVTGLSKDQIREYIKEVLDSLLFWRAAQDACNAYLPYSAAWETLPGMAQAELKTYQSFIESYKSWQVNKNNYTGMHQTWDFQPKKEVKEACTNFDSLVVVYKPMVNTILSTMCLPVEEQIQQAKEYQFARISPYSDEALSAKEARGVDVRTDLRLQLAELRVWDTALSYAVKGSDVEGRNDSYDDILQQNLKQFSITGYSRAWTANAEAKNMQPVIHSYRTELENQYEKYATAAEGSGAASTMPTTDKTPDEVQKEIQAIEALYNEKAEKVELYQKGLDEYVANYGETGDAYETYKKELDAAKAEFEKIEQQYNTLQAQLIYACLQAGDRLIDEINRDPSVYDKNVQELQEQIAALEEKLGLEPGAAIPPELLPDTSKFDDEDDEDEEGFVDDEEGKATGAGTAAGTEDKELTQEQIDAHQLKEAREALAELLGEEVLPDEKEEEYKPFPEFSALSEGELYDEIREYEAEIDTICSDTSDLYRDLLAQYEKYKANPAAWEYQSLMSLARSFSNRYERVEALYRALAQANAELKMFYPPATLEEAEERFVNEYTNYYYAQRDYQEFSELEMAMIQGEYEQFKTNSSYFDCKCWADVYAENEDAKRLLNERFEELETVYLAAKRILFTDDSGDGRRHTGDYLSDMEAYAEIALAGDNLKARIAEVEKSYNDAKAKLDAVAKTMHVVDVNQINLAKDSRFNTPYAASGAQTVTRLGMIDQLIADQKIWEFVAYSGNPEYIEAAAYAEMCRVRYEGPADIRKDLLERTDIMTDQFALQVDTGATAGTGKILFFTVCYKDVDGVERKEYLFPTLDANEKTEKRVSELTNGARPVNNNHMETMASLGQTGSSISEIQSLDSWSTDTYLFSTGYHMAEGGFESFEAFGENVHTSILKTDANAKNAWSCCGMRLYHVNDVFGQSVYGYGGSDQTRVKLEFQGEQIGALNKFNYAVSWSCAKMLHFNEASGEFTIDRNIYDYKTEKIGPGSVAGKLDQRSDEESEYLFKLDFADSYGAGVEALVTRYSDNEHTTTSTADGPVMSVKPCQIKDLGLPECLVYTIVYYDMNDCRRQVRVPVITSSLAWAVDHGIKAEDSIFGYAQQGDSLVFSAYLPDMKEISLEESYLCFEAVSGWAASSKASGSSKTHINERLSLLNSTVTYESVNASGKKESTMGSYDTEIRLSGMQIYAPGTYTASVALENGIIEPTVEGAPAYFGAAATVNGDSYGYGEKVRLTNLRTDYQEGTKLHPRSDGQKYMVIISTDYTALSATVESPNVTVNYVSLSGRVVSSAAEDVGVTSRDYYGYWPGINNEDITAQRATGESGELKMLFTIDDLNYFSDILISMDSSARDDWQISRIKILKLNTLGKRQGVWEGVRNSRKEFISDRSYDRLLDGDVILDKEETVLIQPGDSKRIVIHGAETEVQEQEDVNWEEKRYYMDLETAMSDLGFTKERANYTVKVKVAGESSSNTVDGDCGSVNPFYFQLVFANGKSGYVLANQQLSGDGFRTGYNETFTICTNRDYGNLKAVRIIPDDTSSNSQIFDKLNIDSIEVSRQSNDAVNRTWVVSKVGWIEIDYHDEAETYSISGRDGRAEGSLARNFNVDYSTYSTKLLFMLNTSQPDANTDHIEELLEGQDEETQAAITRALTEQSQFQGEVKLNLTYRDSKGNVQHDTFDMVQAIAAYANKKINTQESADTEGNIIHSETVSDTSYMFRMGHTDRFELEVRDAQRLLNASIIATGVSDQSCFWKIGDFRVKMINESGVLNINHNNEYEKTNAANAQELCWGKGMPFTMWVPARHTEEIQFNFSDNEIDVNLEDNSWEVAAERVPDTDNDVANVYVYLTDDSKIPAALMSQIKYTNGYGLSYQTAYRELLPMSNGSKGFYAVNMDVMGMSVLNSITLDTLDAAAGQGVKIDHVVVQQVRSDVVISTYTCNLEGNSGTIPAGGKLTIYPGGTGNQGGGVTFNTSSQVMTLGFGANTETARLVAENRDIAVAIRYTTSNDANGREYNSPYVYLTDQQIKSITAGGTAQIVFHEPYVSSIKGMVILATGKLKAELETACVGVYEKDPITEEDQCKLWYSFSNFRSPVILSAQSRLLGPSVDSTMAYDVFKINTVCPLVVNFTTGTVSDSAADPQTADPIKMVVSYVDTDDQSREVTFTNIRNNLVEGGFGPGETAKIRVMLVGVKEITNITVEPYSANSAVVSQDDWYIASVSLAMNNNTKVYSYSRTIGRSTVQKTPLEINTQEIKLQIITETRLINALGIPILQTENSLAGPIKQTVQPGQRVKLIPTISGSKKGFTVSVVCSSYVDDLGNPVGGTIPVQDAISLDDGAYIFSRNDVGNYFVTFTSAEDPKVSETVLITVAQPFGFNAHSLVVYTGDSVNIAIDATKYRLGMTWSSSDTAVADVTSLELLGATVTGIAPGKVTITARDPNGRTESCTVEVVNAPIHVDDDDDDEDDDTDDADDTEDTGGN